MKKRLLAILLAAIMVVSLLPVSAFAGTETQTPAYAASGTGTADDPYLISTVTHLNELADAVNGGSNMSNKYFKLTQDITDAVTKVIGGDKPFRGIFDGDFHSVTLNITEGIYYAGNGDCYAGLFGRLDASSATIKNLIVTGNVNVESTGGASSTTRVGGVCGKLEQGTIQNCGNTTATIQAKSEAGTLTIGGICGHNTGGTVKNCYNRGARSLQITARHMEIREPINSSAA